MGKGDSYPQMLIDPRGPTDLSGNYSEANTVKKAAITVETQVEDADGFNPTLLSEEGWLELAKDNWGKYDEFNDYYQGLVVIPKVDKTKLPVGLAGKEKAQSPTQDSDKPKITLTDKGKKALFEFVRLKLVNAGKKLFVDSVGPVDKENTRIKLIDRVNEVLSKFDLYGHGRLDTDGGHDSEGQQKYVLSIYRHRVSKDRPSDADLVKKIRGNIQQILDKIEKCGPSLETEIRNKLL